MIAQEKIRELSFGKQIEKIGRLVFKDNYEKGLSFDDFDGDVIIVINGKKFYFHPYPTLKGDTIDIYDDLNDKKLELLEVFFDIKHGYTAVISDIEYKYDEDNLLYKIRFKLFNGNIVSLSVEDSDEIEISYT